MGGGLMLWRLAGVGADGRRGRGRRGLLLVVSASSGGWEIWERWRHTLRDF